MRETERFEKEGSEESHVVQLQRVGGGGHGARAHMYFRLKLQQMFVHRGQRLHSEKRVIVSVSPAR